jgi:hypothetical protein
MQAGNLFQLRAEPYAGGQGCPSADKPQKKLPVPVRFLIKADSLEEARDQVRQVIEHGKETHDPEIEWEWSVG